MKKNEIIKSSQSSNTHTFIFFNYDVIRLYYTLREMILLGLKPLKKSNPYLWDPNDEEDDLYN
jgi:hypothetical protein